MRYFLTRLLVIIVVAAALTSALVLGTRAVQSYMLADAARDATWRQATAQRLAQLACEADDRRVR